MLIAASVLLVSRLVTPPVTPAPVPNALGASVGGIIYVNDDDIGDPGPHNPLISNPLEDGSQTYPFDSVQEALDRCASVDTIQIEAGLYVESLRVRGGGCRLVGRGQGATVLAGGVLLSLSESDSEAVNLTIEQMTLRDGGVSISQRAYLADGHAVLSDVSLERAGLSFDSLDSGLSAELSRVSMDGEGIGVSTSSFGRVSVSVQHLNAPATLIGVSGGIGGQSWFDLSDSVIAGIEASSPSEGVLGISLNRVQMTTDGIRLWAFNGRYVDLRADELLLESGGLQFIARPDPNGYELFASIDINRATFQHGGATFDIATQSSRALAYDSSYFIGFTGSSFVGEGVRVSVASGIDSLGLSSSFSFLNSEFTSAGAGLEVLYATAEAAGAVIGRIESQLNLVNNTFSANDTGIKLTTTPHTPGLHSFSTLIKNNIIAGGRTGIEVHGLDDHTFTAENNDVLGRADRRYVGDLPDQTGRNGNISLPPWFVGANDFRLQKISPCIDRGGIGAEVPPTDIDGLARPQDGNGDNVIAPDMGAHERPGPKDRRSVTLRKL